MQRPAGLERDQFGFGRHALDTGVIAGIGADDAGDGGAVAITVEGFAASAGEILVAFDAVGEVVVMDVRTGVDDRHDHAFAGGETMRRVDVHGVEAMLHRTVGIIRESAGAGGAEGLQRLRRLHAPVGVQASQHLRQRRVIGHREHQAVHTEHMDRPGIHLAQRIVALQCVDQRRGAGGHPIVAAPVPAAPGRSGATQAGGYGIAQRDHDHAFGGDDRV